MGEDSNTRGKLMAASVLVGTTGAGGAIGTPSDTMDVNAGIAPTGANPCVS